MKPGHPKQIRSTSNSWIDMNNAFVPIRRKGRNKFIHQAFPEKKYESVFVELDKTVFNVNRNIIIGEIYNSLPQN